MEIFELRYFLGVAREENIQRASERLHVSPAALSKAVARLEDELGTQLFAREGRNIFLTIQGRLLQTRAAEILRLEEETRFEVSGEVGSSQMILAGPEVLLSKMGVRIAAETARKNSQVYFEFQATSESLALERVARGEAHIALVTTDVPKELTSKRMSRVQFQTYVGLGHPLYKFAKTGRAVPVEEVLTYSFASPDHPLLGKVGIKPSLDGWRDDRFPRKITYLVSSLRTLEQLVVSGNALAYLPDYFAEDAKMLALEVTGCPYTCSQEIRMVAKNPRDSALLRSVFD